MIQVGAVIAREVAIGVATGGIGTVATATAGAAGRLAAGMAVRWGGFGAGRQALRAGAQIACRLSTAARVAQPYFAYRNVSNIANNVDRASAALENGDFETAAALLARSAGMIPGTLSSLRETTRLAGSLVSQGPTRTWQYLQACFAADTPILGEHGSRPVQEHQVGDRVWARPEYEPNGPLALKEIEECFQTEAEIWNLHVRDQVIRTTAEHPFWVKGQGWTPTRELLPGDVVVGRDGEETPVVDLCSTGVRETVYNFRVADYHTYYVGGDDWPFSVWAHNLCRARQMEQRAQDVAAARGETVIQTQWAVNPTTGFGRGFDFASVVGTGASAKLFLNEVKSNRSSMVRATSFTAFGLGAAGRPNLALNIRKAEEAIMASSLDPATKDVVRQQLLSNSALIRIICRPTRIDTNTTSFIQSETGMNVQVGF